MRIEEPKSGETRGSFVSPNPVSENIENKEGKFDPEAFKADLMQEILGLVEGMLAGTINEYLQEIYQTIEEIKNTITNINFTPYIAGNGIAITGNTISINHNTNGLTIDANKKLQLNYNTDGLTISSGALKLYIDTDYGLTIGSSKLKLNVDTNQFQYSTGALQDKLDSC